MRESDADFCVRMLRHAAIGAIIGGPIAAAGGWALSPHVAEAMGGGEAGDAGPVALIFVIAALLLGVWIGATLACSLSRPESAEETCYGGALGCLVYVVGGVLGALVGPRIPGIELHPVAWYLIGGSVMGLVGLAVTVLSPHRRGKREMDASDTEQPGGDENAVDSEEDTSS